MKLIQELEKELKEELNKEEGALFTKVRCKIDLEKGEYLGSLKVEYSIEFECDSKKLISPTQEEIIQRAKIIDLRAINIAEL